MKSHTISVGGSKQTLKAPASSYDLLPGEDFGFSEEMGEDPASDEELNNRYVKGDFRIVSESARYSLAGILAMLEEEVYVDGKTGGEKENVISSTLNTNAVTAGRTSANRNSSSPFLSTFRSRLFFYTNGTLLVSR